MSGFDLGLLAALTILFAGMVTGSRVIRAIVFDMVLHPFSPSRVELNEEGKVRVIRGAELNQPRPAPKVHEAADTRAR